MSTIQAILMGIIQGLTEFLPVSSSGHLVFTSNLYKLITGHQMSVAGSEEIFLDIILHVGTLVAVFIFFKDDLVKIIKEFVNAVKTRDFSSTESKLPLYLFIGTIFTVLVAYPMKDFTEKLVSNPVIVGGFLILTGFILFLSETISDKLVKKDTVDLKTAIVIGIAQGIAAFPGISRSGTTICAGLIMGLDRVTSARYSFLLSILIIMATSIFYPILEFHASEMVAFNWGALIVGFLFSTVVGYFCIKYFIQFLNKHSLKCFAYYCWIIGILMAVLFHSVG